MNSYQNPGAGNGHGSGHGSGQRNVHGSEQGFAHRQGQSLLNRPYSGLHGGFQYDDAPQAGQAYPPYQSHADQPREGNPHLLPAVVPQTQNQLLPAPPQSSGGGGFSLANLTKYANLTEIKGLVDRMGGLDGILSTVTKVQKVVGSVSQMAPLVKVFMGSFGKKSESGNNGNPGPALSRPKPRKRRPGSSGRRPPVKRRSRPRRRR